MSYEKEQMVVNLVVETVALELVRAATLQESLVTEIEEVMAVENLVVALEYVMGATLPEVLETEMEIKEVMAGNLVAEMAATEYVRVGKPPEVSVTEIEEVMAVCLVAETGALEYVRVEIPPELSVTVALG